MTNDFQQAAKGGISIFIGYVPAAIAFGILSKASGITFLECLMFSGVVFAGASQFIALNLLLAGMSPGGVILTTLLVNFRHFLMSASLSTRISQGAKKFLYMIAFGVTDEVFSVLSFKKGPLSKTFIFTLELSAYSAWVSGTVLGFIVGGFLPDVLTKSMGVALYALLLAILLPEMKKSTQSLILAISAGLLNTILIKLDILPEGWTIIVCIIIIASAGAFLVKNEEQGEVYG